MCTVYLSQLWIEHKPALDRPIQLEPEDNLTGSVKLNVHRGVVRHGKKCSEFHPSLSWCGVFFPFCVCSGCLWLELGRVEWGLQWRQQHTCFSSFINTTRYIPGTVLRSLPDCPLTHSGKDLKAIYALVSCLVQQRLLFPVTLEDNIFLYPVLVG